MEIDLDKLFEEMPDENAGENEINAFMERVLAMPGGEKLIRDFAERITGGGELDTMLKEEDAELESLTLKSPARFIFRVELTGTKPLVWRRLSLPADCAYFHLHSAIQDVFGWSDQKEHRFEVWSEGVRELTFSLAETGDDDFCEIGNRVSDLFGEEIFEFLYRYDFLADWCHRVVIEQLVLEDAKGIPTEFSAQVHGGEGHGPPEACGGVKGYHAFLQGEHTLCSEYDAGTLSQFRDGKPDFSKLVFQDPKNVLKRHS